MTTYKSFMKGLRYFSQMFETEKEEEMEIGFPTDVKHVAHIGNDGSSSSNTPSWMNEYQGVSETSSAALNSNGKPPAHHTAKSNAKDLKIEGSSRDTQKFSEAPIESPNRSKTKHSMRQANTGSDSPDRERSVIQKPRRHKNPSIESSGKKHNSNLESPRRPSNSKMGAESPSRDPNVAPKPARRKKKGGSVGEGSTRSRSKNSELQTEGFPYSDPGPGHEMDSSEICQKSILSKYKEKKDCEENSREIHVL